MNYTTETSKEREGSSLEYLTLDPISYVLVEVGIKLISWPPITFLVIYLWKSPINECGRNSRETTAFKAAVT